ncbi:hypothetical protein [Alsobacter sp. SYSU BS001988]
MRYHLHQKIAGHLLLDPHGFEAAQADAVNRVQQHFTDLQQNEFLSPFSVALETANGRSVLILFFDTKPRG